LGYAILLLNKIYENGKIYLFLFSFVLVLVFVFVFHKFIGTVLFNALNPIESGPARLKEELKKKNIPTEQFHDTYIGEIIKVEKSL